MNISWYEPMRSGVRTSKAKSAQVVHWNAMTMWHHVWLLKGYQDSVPPGLLWLVALCNVMNVYPSKLVWIKTMQQCCALMNFFADSHVPLFTSPELYLQVILTQGLKYTYFEYMADNPKELIFTVHTQLYPRCSCSELHFYISISAPTTALQYCINFN